MYVYSTKAEVGHKVPQHDNRWIVWKKKVPSNILALASNSINI